MRQATRHPLPAGLICTVLLLLVMLAPACRSWAQAPPPSEPPSAVASDKPAQPQAPEGRIEVKTSEKKGSPDSEVTGVESLETSDTFCPPKKEEKAKPLKKSEECPEAQLRDTIVVHVSNLQDLVDRAAPDKKKIVLYLNDRPMVDLVADPPTNPKQNVLKFQLKRTETSRDAWSSILGKPPLWCLRKIKVSVGIEDEFALTSNATLCFLVLPHGWFMFWLAIFAVLIIVFWRLAQRSNLLREDVPTLEEGARPPFSLARCQAAWWFFVVLASYLFIGLVTGDYSTSITGTVLVLLGIASGTTFASAIVDKSKDTPVERAKQKAAIAALATKTAEDRVKEAQEKLKADPANVQMALTYAEMTETAKVEQSYINKLKNKSEDFFTDILSDANGVNLHRFQMMAWTVVLSIVFVAQVYRELAMPQFSETLLSLMGISAATFLGLKTTEPTVPTKPDPEPAESVPTKPDPKQPQVPTEPAEPE